MSSYCSWLSALPPFIKGSLTSYGVGLLISLGGVLEISSDRVQLSLCSDGTFCPHTADYVNTTCCDHHLRAEPSRRPVTSSVSTSSPTTVSTTAKPAVSSDASTPQPDAKGYSKSDKLYDCFPRFSFSRASRPVQLEGSLCSYSP